MNKALIITSLCLLIFSMFSWVTQKVHASSPVPGPSGVGICTVADNPLTTSYTLSGNLDAIVVVVPYDYANNPSGVFVVSDIPPGATVAKALVYHQEWQYVSGTTASSTLAGHDLGYIPALTSDPGGGLHLAVYRWDVTSIVTGNGEYPFTTTGLTQVYGAALVVVYSSPDRPASEVIINDGAESMQHTTATTEFFGVGAGPGKLIIYTQACDPYDTGEMIAFNSDIVGGPIDANVGSYASLFTLPVTTVLGQNTASITTFEDWFGWHLAILVSAPGDTAPPIAHSSDIDGQPQVMYPDEPYTVTAKYFDPNGREDLKYCYLQLLHPDKPLTMMWYQADGHAAPWAGEEGEDYLTIVNVDADPITEGGLEGYELAWTFTINDQWPEVEGAIDFGVYAWDDADLKSGWDYDSTKASFLLTAPSLTVVDIEPIQVITDAEALIMKKGTVVRATVHSTLETQIWVEIGVTYDFGTKSYVETGPYGNGVPIDPGLNIIYLPGGPASSESTTYESWSTSPRWFYWTTSGTDTDVEVQVDPSSKVLEAGAGGRAVTEMDVVQCAPLRVLVVPVYFPLNGEFPYYPSPEHLIDQFDFLLGTYPVADLDLQVTYADARAIWKLRPGACICPNPSNPSPLCPWHRRNGDDWLYRNVVTPISEEASILGYDRVVIVINFRTGWAGIAIGMLRQPENRLPVVLLNGALQREALVAHEIGHTYYLWHPHDWDPYRLGPPVYDAQRFWVMMRDYEQSVNTFMSYRDPPHWIDKGRFDSDSRTWVDLSQWGYPGTWRWNLFEQFRLNNQPEVVSLSGGISEYGSVTNSSSKIIVLRGEFHRDGTALAESWHCLSEGTPDQFLDAPGSHSVVLLDDDDQILEQLHFNVSFSYLLDIDGVLTPMETDVMPFLFSIPYVDGTSVIQIRDASGNVLVSRRISPNAPTVNVAYPNGGEVLAGLATHTVSWQAHDLDGDALTFLLSYSANGGQTWIPIASELTETSYAWDTSLLAGGTDYLVKVIASDGINTGHGVSEDTFTILAGWTDATVDFGPNVLNLRARGGLATVYIELPEGFDAHDIDISSIRLNGIIPALSWPTSIGDYNNNGIPDLMVKFDRRAAQAILDTGEAVEITITGEVDGIPFMGVDTIRVIG